MLLWISNRHLTLKMASAQDVETSVTTNSPSRDSFHPDDQIPPKCPLLLLTFLLLSRDEEKDLSTELRSHRFLNCYEWLRRYFKLEQFFHNETTKRNFLRKFLTIVRKHTSSSVHVQEMGWINRFKSRSNNFTICLQGFYIYVTTLFELLR